MPAGLDATTLRFIVTGLSAAGLMFVLSFGFVRAGLPPFPGTLLAYAITVVVTYAVQQSWTFRGRSRHAEAFPRYAAVQVVCALCSGGAAQGLSSLGVPHLAMAALTTIASSAISYVLSRWWVFRV